jgi:hypothetical protein
MSVFGISSSLISPANSTVQNRLEKLGGKFAQLTQDSQSTANSQSASGTTPSTLSIRRTPILPEPPVFRHQPEPPVRGHEPEPPIRSHEPEPPIRPVSTEPPIQPPISVGPMSIDPVSTTSVLGRAWQQNVDAQTSVVTFMA